MSSLRPELPEMPRIIGGQILPDFLNAKIIESDIKLPVPIIPDKYDFSIKKSDAFGTAGGQAFDEGATWFPLQFVEFTRSDLGLASYRGHYAQSATAIYGSHHANEHKIPLDKDEHIKGISGTFTDKLTSLQVHTTKNTHRIGNESGQSFKFEVPRGHHVVGFHGRSDDHIRAIGVSYSQRLASIASTVDPFLDASASAFDGNPAFDDAIPGPSESPNIKPMYSNIYLDHETKDLWKFNNMSAIEQKRNQAKSDLQPIYDNIKKNGKSAWTLVEADGQRYYLSSTANACIWTYVNDTPTVAMNTNSTDQPKTKTSIVSVGSYSKQASILGLSGYVWDNIPITVAASAIALTFAILMQGLIADGIAWGIEFAATQLASAAVLAGVEELALLIPASVATGGGLIIAGIVGVGLFLAVMAISNVIFRKYYLTVNVFNFDADHKWNSVKWHSDNADIPNGQWKPESLDKFSPATAMVMPPGFKPVKNLDNVVTYMSVAFTNVHTFLEGLGMGILLVRDDNSAGLAIKYNLRRILYNEIGVLGIKTSDPSKFDLGGYYSSGWVGSQSTSTNLGNLQITAHTPYRSGAPGNAYEYNVNIGLPV